MRMNYGKKQQDFLPKFFDPNGKSNTSSFSFSDHKPDNYPYLPHNKHLFYQYFNQKVIGSPQIAKGPSRYQHQVQDAERKGSETIDLGTIFRESDSGAKVYDLSFSPTKSERIRKKAFNSTMRRFSSNRKKPVGTTDSLIPEKSSSPPAIDTSNKLSNQSQKHKDFFQQAIIRQKVENKNRLPHELIDEELSLHLLATNQGFQTTKKKIEHLEKLNISFYQNKLKRHEEILFKKTGVLEKIHANPEEKQEKKTSGKKKKERNSRIERNFKEKQLMCCEPWENEAHEPHTFWDKYY